MTAKKIIIASASALIILGIINGGINCYGAGSPYETIISNASGIENKEYPLRRSISTKSIEKIKFLNPQQLKKETRVAIFVLPNRPLDEVTPSIDSVYRALKGVELFKKFPKSALIMVGPKSVGDIPEAQMMALVAWSRGIDPSKIIVEDKARSTEDKAKFIAETTRSNNIGKVFIVSKKEHLKRIIPYFQSHYKDEFKNVEGVDCGISKELIIKQMEEYLKIKNDKVVRSRLRNVKSGSMGMD